MAEEPFCSFCGKDKSAVRKLIAGGGRQPNKDRVLPPVCICNECIALCNEIIAAETPEKKQP